MPNKKKGPCVVSKSICLNTLREFHPSTQIVCIKGPKSSQCSIKPTSMKKVISNYGSRLSGFCCSIFGHRYIVSKKVTLHIKEYKCMHCAKEVTTDVSGNLSALTPELQDINNTLENLYQKRHRATQQQVA